MAFHKLLEVDALWAGEMRAVSTAAGSILLVNIDDQIFAYEDRCAHLGIPLSSGKLKNCVLTCAAHEWQYDARTGSGLNPRRAKLRALAVKIVQNAIWVDLPENL